MKAPNIFVILMILLVAIPSISQEQTETPITMQITHEGVFAQPQIPTDALRNFVDIRVPEEIRNNSEWRFNAQAMAYTRALPDETLEYYRWHMGDTPEEDLEFGSHFRQQDAFRIYDESGNIVFNLSFELSTLDPNLTAFYINPDLSTLYGISREEFAFELQNILYSTFPLLEERGINDIRIAIRTGISYSSSDSSNNRRYERNVGILIPDNGAINLELNANSHTLVLNSALDQRYTTSYEPILFNLNPMGSLIIALIHRQAEADGIRRIDVSIGENLRSLLSDIWSIGSNEQFAIYQENAAALFQVESRE